MTGGYYRMHRGWMDNPALGGKREPFCHRAAWCWLIEHASWKPKRENLGGQTVELERGQLTASLRYLADCWGWSVGSVRRFIDRLKTDSMIGTATGTGQLVITICNYEKYQAEPEFTGTADDTASGTGPAQQRHKIEERKEGKKESPPSEGAEAPADLKTVLYRLGKEVLGNKSGGQVTNLIRHHGNNLDATLATLRLASKKSDPAEYVGGILRGDRQPETDWDIEYKRMGVML